MVDSVNIVFEGSGNLRPGFNQLFHPHLARARVRRIRFKLIAGGSRIEAVKNFLIYCSSEPSSLNILLIDSERPVSDTARYINDHLRAHSVWDRNLPCSDEQLHFMVQAMEAWFIADPKTFRARFGQNYNTNSLPHTQNAEAVPPADLIAAIRRGLPQNRRRRGYDKVSDAVELLRLIDVSLVQQHCPYFRRLWKFLENNL